MAATSLCVQLSMQPALVDVNLRKHLTGCCASLQSWHVQTSWVWTRLVTEALSNSMCQEECIKCSPGIFQPQIDAQGAGQGSAGA